MKHRILCPIDLSENSHAAIELATDIAKARQATLVFLYVSPRWMPNDPMFGNDYVRTLVADDKASLEQLRPTDSEVKFEHLFEEGNAAPEIVKAAEGCDMVVISTHGRSGLIRLVLGSVAQYVMRNANCPVVSIRSRDIEEATTKKKEPRKSRFVTEIMHQVSPVHAFDGMDTVLNQLVQAGEDAAPVVDGAGECIGILTKSDIFKYRDLYDRFEQHDESVVDEIFEVDQYGQRRPATADFHQVKRHMTTPVVTIENNQSELAAKKLFEENPKIHHLVVVDSSNRALGILDHHDIENRQAETARQSGSQ